MHIKTVGSLSRQFFVGDPVANEDAHPGKNAPNSDGQWAEHQKLVDVHLRTSNVASGYVKIAIENGH